MSPRGNSYPEGWFDAGGPLRLYAEPPFDRHQAGAAPGGGFNRKTSGLR
ncbi:DUF6349 family protein [Streptomyces olindensis]|uniref:DUF6349 family protein n=1 Tax=Streptomyces olindensis TaxID=358823 RepID=A0ABV2XLK6_9ACTN